MMKSNWLIVLRRILKIFYLLYFLDLWCDIMLGVSCMKLGNSMYFREGFRVLVFWLILIWSFFIFFSFCCEVEEILLMLLVFYLFIYKLKIGVWIWWGVRVIWREFCDDGVFCLGMKIMFFGFILFLVCVLDRVLKCFFYIWIFFWSLMCVLGFS